MVVCLLQAANDPYMVQLQLHHLLFQLNIQNGYPSRTGSQWLTQVVLEKKAVKQVVLMLFSTVVIVMVLLAMPHNSNLGWTETIALHPR